MTAEESVLEQHSTAWRWWVVLLVALVVRGWGVQAQSLTMDEWFELDLAHHSVQHIVTKGDGFPPLYNLTLKSTIHWFGDSAARWLSVLFSVIAIPFVMGTGQILGGKRTGWIAGAICALMPISVWHAQEARAYALMILAAAIGIYYVVRIITGNTSKWNWWGLGTGLALGTYCHYFFAFCALYLLITLLLVGGRKCARPLLATCFGVGLTCLPWLFCLQDDFEAQASWPDKSGMSLASLGFTYFSFISGYTLGPSLRELHVLPVKDALFAVLPWFFATAAAIGLMFAGADSPIRRSRLMLFLLTAPVIVGIVGTISGVGFLGRYVAWCYIPLAVCLALWCSHVKRRRLSIAGVIVLLSLFVIAIVNRHAVDAYRNAAVNEAADRISASNPRPVIVVSGYMAPVLGYYLADDWDYDYQKEVERSFSGDWTLWRLGHRSLPDERRERFELLLSKIEPGQEVWLVYSRAFHEDDGGHLLQAFRSRMQGELVAEFAGARLYAGTRPPAAESNNDSESL